MSESCITHISQYFLCKFSIHIKYILLVPLMDLNLIQIISIKLFIKYRRLNGGPFDIFKNL